jgi:hypothetical protein
VVPHKPSTITDRHYIACQAKLRRHPGTPGFVISRPCMKIKNSMPLLAGAWAASGLHCARIIFCNAGRSLLFPEAAQLAHPHTHSITSTDSLARNLRIHNWYRMRTAHRPHSSAQRMLRSGNRKRNLRWGSWCSGSGRSFDNSFDSSFVGLEV